MCAEDLQKTRLCALLRAIEFYSILIDFERSDCGEFLVWDGYVETLGETDAYVVFFFPKIKHFVMEECHDLILKKGIYKDDDHGGLVRKSFREALVRLWTAMFRSCCGVKA